MRKYFLFIFLFIIVFGFNDRVKAFSGVYRIENLNDNKVITSVSDDVVFSDFINLKEELWYINNDNIISFDNKVLNVSADEIVLSSLDDDMTKWSFEKSWF